MHRVKITIIVDVKDWNDVSISQVAYNAIRRKTNPEREDAGITKIHRVTVDSDLSAWTEVQV